MEINSELEITIMPHKDDNDPSCAVFIKGFKNEGEAKLFTQIIIRNKELTFDRYEQHLTED